MNTEPNTPRGNADGYADGCADGYAEAARRSHTRLISGLCGVALACTAAIVLHIEAVTRPRPSAQTQQHQAAHQPDSDPVPIRPPDPEPTTIPGPTLPQPPRRP
jgi:hypothetical protein